MGKEARTHWLLHDLFLLSGFCFLLKSLVLTCAAHEILSDLLLSTGLDHAVAFNSQKGETLLLPPLYNVTLGRAIPDIKI